MPKNLKILQLSLRDSYAARLKKKRFLSQSKGSLQETTKFISFAAPFAKRPKVVVRQSSWPKSTWPSKSALTGGTTNIVNSFCSEKRGDRFLARLDILEISQLVTRRRRRYLRKTYLWLSTVLLQMSLSQRLRKLALKPRRKTLLSVKLTMKAL